MAAALKSTRPWRRALIGFWRRGARFLRLTPHPTPKGQLTALLNHPDRRTPAEWRAWRKATTSRVQDLLANKKGLVAARELSRALLQDPLFPDFDTLMQEAVVLKVRRDIKTGKPDPWADLPEDLREHAIQLEGFKLYTEEVEQLLDKAGYQPCPSPLPKTRQAPTGVSRGGNTAAN